jgi:hypothetical protein
MVCDPGWLFGRGNKGDFFGPRFARLVQISFDFAQDRLSTAKNGPFGITIKM